MGSHDDHRSTFDAAVLVNRTTVLSLPRSAPSGMISPVVYDVGHWRMPGEE
jgi:hypothetical protein